MSKPRHENRPLLCDEPSDEELKPFSSQPNYLRHTRLARGRAKSKVKGAAHIISRWPEHWSLPTNYWWTGVAMFCLLIFVLYNGVAAFSLLPPNHLRQHRLRTIEEHSSQSALPNVFMHTMVNNVNEFDVHKYHPYIATFITKFPGLTYNFIVFLNDTYHTPMKSKTTEEIDEDAPNLLVFDNIENEIGFGKTQKLNIVYLSLVKYLDESPLMKKWRQLPNHFIPFLVRAISLWEKGGIAFNPDILLQDSEKRDYCIDKIKGIMKNFTKFSEPTDNKTFKDKLKPIKPKNTVNNIRDIIDLLESDNGTDGREDLLQINPVGDENKNINVYAISKGNNENTNNITKLKSYHKNIITRDTSNSNHSYLHDVNSHNSFLYDKLDTDNERIYNKNVSQHNPIHNAESNVTTQRVIFEPIVPIGKKIYRSPNSYRYTSKDHGEESNVKLTIDLKGNIIATESPCHAFIGTLFSSSYHYTEEQSVADYIIRELSLFCNGLLSVCKGIDVIML